MRNVGRKNNRSIWLIVFCIVFIGANCLPTLSVDAAPLPLVPGKWTGTFDKEALKMTLTINPNGTLSILGVDTQLIAAWDGIDKTDFIYRETMAARGSSAGIMFNTQYVAAPSLPYKFIQGKLIVDKALYTTRMEEKSSPRIAYTKKVTEFYIDMEGTVSYKDGSYYLTGTMDISNNMVAAAPSRIPWQASMSDLTAEDWFNAGNDAVDAGEFQRAIDCYTKSIELDPQRVGSNYANRSIAYSALGQNDKALDDLGRALDSTTDEKRRAAIFWNRYCIYEEMGKPDLAKQEKERAQAGGINGVPSSGYWDK